MDKKDAVFKEDMWLGTIDKAVEYLENCRQNGENVYIEFNGKKLYSCDITVDGAYMQVLGLTKQEDSSIREAMSKAQTDEERDALYDKWQQIIDGHKKEQKGGATLAEAPFHNLEGAVKYLQECNSNGENVYIDFNGHKLYSCDVTMDSAYLEVVGLTKAEDDETRQAFAEATTEEEERAIYDRIDEMRKRHEDEKNQKVSDAIVQDAVKETEETTKASTIETQAKGIGEAIKGDTEKETTRGLE